MRYMIALIPLIRAALGVLAIIGGGYDDAPGLQLIGALLILGAVVIAMRTARRAELYDEASSVDRQEAARHSAGCFLSVRVNWMRNRPAVLLGAAWRAELRRRHEAVLEK